MAKPIDTALQVTRPKVVSEMIPEEIHDIVPKVTNEVATLNLFNIDPHAEPEKPLKIDLKLDQLENSE